MAVNLYKFVNTPGVIKEHLQCQILKREMILYVTYICGGNKYDCMNMKAYTCIPLVVHNLLI